VRARSRVLGAPAAPSELAAASATRARPARARDQWVSGAAVRQAVGAWAYTRPGAAPHPGDDLVRAAVAVACAVAECAAAAERSSAEAWRAGARADAGGGDGGLTRPVAYEPARLADLAGLAPRDVERALELLQGAGVVRRTQDAAGAHLALDAGVLAPLPAVARVDWPGVRRRLGAIGAGVGAPTAVLRALAERVGAVDLSPEGPSGGDVPPVRASVRDLEDATRFGRSTVSDAVAALVRARVLDADTRAGHTGRFVVRPAAFGLPDEEPAVDGATGSAIRPTPGHAYPPAEPARPAPAGPAGVPAVAPTGGAAPTPVLVGTFAGTPIYAPPGTPLVVECDADGRWTCRVGPLQLGPVGGPA